MEHPATTSALLKEQRLGIKTFRLSYSWESFTGSFSRLPGILPQEFETKRLVHSDHSSWFDNCILYEGGSAGLVDIVCGS